MPVVHLTPRRSASRRQPERPRSWFRLLTPSVLLRSRRKRNTGNPEISSLFVAPTVPPGVIPEELERDVSIAFDENIQDGWQWAESVQNTYGAAFAEGVTFMGYPYLAALCQRPEYRVVSETIAGEMTREWIELKSRSDDESKADRIKDLNNAMERFRLKDVFRTIAEQDGFFGRSHIYIDLGEATDDREDLLTSIGDGRNKISREKIVKGSLNAFRPVEAVWTYPTRYESNDPLKANWYKPRTWFVMGKELHESRLLTFIGREVPDLLKPAYSFGGLSMNQMMKPYVDNWLRTRQSVSDLIHTFSVSGLKTNLGVSLQQGGDELFNRLDFFNNTRDNAGAIVIDKETEEWFNVQTSLSTLDQLQAQSQEHMAAVSRIPLVKLLGISPHGLNASTEGEIRAFYDWVAAFQEKMFRRHLTTCLDILQLNEFGDIDEDITYDFRTLWQLDDAGKVGVEKTKTDIDDANVAMGTIGPDEVRLRLATDKNSIYFGLDLDPDKLPEPPGMPGMPGMGGPPGPGGENDNDDDEGGPPGPPQREQRNPPRNPLQNVTTVAARKGGAGEAWDRMAFDGAFTATFSDDGSQIVFDRFNEADHPRGQPDNSGQFVEGSGSSGRTSAKAGHVKREEGATLPKHIASLKIPPAWSDVTYHPDPKADLVVAGKDAKGRPVAIYSDRFKQKQAAAKFARIKELNKKFERVAAENEKMRRSRDPRTRDAADALKLIMTAGLRPGSDRDTQAAQKAYGATTLEGRHVTTNEDGSVTLKFVGKKGVDLKIDVTDKDTADMLKARAAKAGPDGKLFPNTDAGRLLRHTHTLDGGAFKTKDFRTLLGTSVAMDEVERVDPPKSKSEYKKMVMNVARGVAQKLANTPIVALQSYINPVVFAPWLAALEKSGDEKGKAGS